MLDTRTIRQTFENMWRSIEPIKQWTLLKRMPVVDDAAKIAAFLASDRANNDRNDNSLHSYDPKIPAVFFALGNRLQKLLVIGVATDTN